MAWMASFLLAFIFSPAKKTNQTDWISVQFNGYAQGTTWSIKYYAKDSAVKKHQIDSILVSLDSSLSIYKPYSLIRRFNASRKGIVADEHLAIVVAKAIDVWQQSGALFDITLQPLVQAWGFSSKKVGHFPNSREVHRLLKCVGTDKIRLEGNRLVKTKPCVRIDVDGIAQGYSVDVLADFLERHHVSNYIVEIGGEVKIKGRKKPGNERMKIGIEAPGEYDFTPSVIQKVISIDHGAVTTSGNYRKYHESNGEKFSHTIDPRTGYPAKNNLVSVTVFARDAITADAYDNVLMTLGMEEALSFTEQRKDIAAYFIYKTHEGTIADTASSRFYELMGSEK
ncbi:MAG: FAD:protein FMN transferase [Chitinophagaceae bacterium]|nr:FAD:protein FMN transferase [Chitinophagaceae bacterium]